MRNRAIPALFLIDFTSKSAGSCTHAHGIYLAEFQSGASLSPSFAREDGMRRHELEMKKLVRDLVVVAMLGIFSIAAFAQKGQDKDKRPVKETVRVVDKKDNNRPPPQNNNQPKQNDKKKP